MSSRESWPPAPDLHRLSWPRRAGALLLRPLTVEDATAALAYRGDPEATRYLNHGVLTEADVRARHADRVRRMERGSGEPLLALAVLDATGVVGDCLLRCEREPNGWQRWIGYVIAPVAQGRGYATLVARELVSLALEVGVGTLFATARSQNTASHRVLAKAGFTPVDGAGPEAFLFRCQTITRSDT